MLKMFSFELVKTDKILENLSLTCLIFEVGEFVFGSQLTVNSTITLTHGTKSRIAFRFHLLGQRQNVLTLIPKQVLIQINF